MNYQQIKIALYDAGRMVDAGEIEAAGVKIRALFAEGCTRADLSACLTAAQIDKLRDHARAASKLAPRKRRTSKRATIGGAS